MADLDMSAHHQDSEGTKSPVLTGAEEEVAQSTHTSMNSPHNEDKEEETHLMTQANSEGSDPTEDVAPHTESPCPQEDNKPLVKPISESLPGELKDETEPLITGEPGLDVSSVIDSARPEEEKTNESTSGDTNPEQVDGPKSAAREDSQEAFNDTEDPGEVECSEPDREDEEEQELGHQISSAQEPYVGHRRTIEDIGPVAKETGNLEEAGSNGGKLFLAALVLVVVPILLHHLVQPKPVVKKSSDRIEVFLREMERVQTEFPHQRADLWTRSRIHLERHLQTAQPSEPVSLILTAGFQAKRTLQCLSRSLASVYSTAVNASVLHIDGASKAHVDSDTVKLEIDSQLQGAFEGGKPVAVIHRFEELPPGSTLIFYRYCDHENAAYKNTFLLFTVLLSEKEIPTKFSLNMVEEMVDDHLQEKFLTDGRPVSFDKMDLDKYGGLWSRISHLILPVATEEMMEEAGC